MSITLDLLKIIVEDKFQVGACIKQVGENRDPQFVEISFFGPQLNGTISRFYLCGNGCVWFTRHQKQTTKNRLKSFRVTSE